MLPASASCSSSTQLALLGQDLAPLKSQSCFLWVKSAWSQQQWPLRAGSAAPHLAHPQGPKPQLGLAGLCSSRGILTLLLCGLAASGGVLVKVSPRWCRRGQSREPQARWEPCTSGLPPLAAGKRREPACDGGTGTARLSGSSHPCLCADGTRCQGYPPPLCPAAAGTRSWWQ